MTRMADLPSSVVRRNFAPDEKQAKNARSTRNTSRRDAIVAFCKQPRTATEVATHAGIGVSNAHQLLTEMAKEGRLKRWRSDEVTGKNGQRMVVYWAAR